MKRVLFALCIIWLTKMPLVAKDLYVSTTGNDAVTYEANDIQHPWLTPHKAWREARAGDVVYFRGGVYTSTEWVETRLYGHHGTAEQPITFTSYPGEKAILDWPECVSGAPFHAAISIHKSYNRIHNLEIRAAFPATTFGGATFYIHAPNTQITHATIRLISVPQPDNSAPIVFYGGSNFSEVSNCRIIGFNQIRSSGVHMFRSVGMMIRNNDISNCLHGIYLKHSNQVTDIPSNRNFFINNFLYDCVDGIIGVPNRTTIRDNVLVNCPMSFGGDGGMGDGYVGADYNDISNNTIFNGFLEFIWAGRPLSEDPNAGCMNNTILNNIIMGDACRWHGYSIPAPSYDYRNTSDFNLYPDRGSNLIKENNIAYSLSGWREHIRTQFNRTVDASSIIGAPVFEGGANPTEISQFRLAVGSPGKNAGSDGMDTGADVSKVGIQPLASLTVTSPNGSESWRQNEIRTITWTAAGVSENLTIELMQGPTLLGVIATGIAPSRGSYTWTVGRLADGTFRSGTNLKIRIRTASGAVAAVSAWSSK